MNYGQIFRVDSANGAGCRTSLFVSGCTHHCKGCFQPETWDFSFGEPYTRAVEDRIVESIEPSYINGLTILGGEPLEPSNQEALMPLIRRVHAMEGKTVWIYSGYTWEELTDPGNPRCRSAVTEELLASIDVLVDGEFRLEQKDISLPFRGSANQRIIDVPRTLEKGEIVLTKYMEDRFRR